MSDIREFCNLSEADLKERRARLSKQLFPLARGREELADGLAIRFDATPAIRQALDDFVACYDTTVHPEVGSFSVFEAGAAFHLVVETFVDPLRFRFTCYRAANWVTLGRTTGRGKDDQTHRPNRPIKEVLGYALTPRFRERLSNESP